MNFIFVLDESTGIMKKVSGSDVRRNMVSLFSLTKELEIGGGDGLR